jgi:hypothetical protein
MRSQRWFLGVLGAWTVFGAAGCTGQPGTAPAEPASGSAPGEEPAAGDTTCSPEAILHGIGTEDQVHQSEAPGADGMPDAVFTVRTCSPGTITAVTVRNTDGRFSVWDTEPGNGLWLLGVVPPGGKYVVNTRIGAVKLDVAAGQELTLYAADNGSIADGDTRYEVELTYADGRTERADVQVP